MTDNQPQPDAGGTLPARSRGTSPMAIASAACAAGALILLGVSGREAFLLDRGATYKVPPAWLLAPLYGGTGACFAAIVLGGMALVQIRGRRARPRGTALALTGLILAGAMLPLLGLIPRLHHEHRMPRHLRTLMTP